MDFEELVSEFEELGVPRELVLTWVPEGYEVNGEPELDESDYAVKYQASFISFLNTEIQFSVRQYYNTNVVEQILFEKDGTSVEQYVSHGRLFYLYGNTDTSSCFAVWSFGEYILEICGDNLSSSDLKRIIDSIGAEL